MREFTIFLDKNGTITLEQVPEPNCNFTSFQVSTGIRIFLDGYIADISCLGNTGEKNILQALYDSVIRGKKYDLLPLLNGHYNIIIVNDNENKLVIITDRYALHPLFYCKTSQGYAISSSLKRISERVDFEKKINYQSLYDFIKFQFVTNENTFFENIKRFKPATINIFDNYKHNSQQYSSWANCGDINNNTVNENANIVFSLLKKSVQRNLQNISFPGVTISGGLDSRVIAGLVSSLSGSSPYFFHCPLSDKETLGAKGVVDVLGGNMVSLPLKRSTERILSLPLELGDGCTSLNQYWLFDLYNKIIANSPVKCIFDGYYLDVLLFPQSTYMYYDKINLAEITPENRVSLFDAVYGLPHGYFEQYFFDAHNHEMEKDALANADVFASDINTKDPDQFCKTLYIKTRGSRYVLPMANVNQNFCDIRFPGLDYDLIQFCMTLPSSQVQYPLVYFELFRKFLPELFQVEWSKTGRPLCEGIIDKKSLTMNLADTTAFYLLRLSRGMFDLHTPKQDLCYQFRKDSNFRQIMLNLFNNNFCIEHGLIGKKGFKQLINNIVIGKNDFFILERLLAIELFFKVFYQSD